MRAALSRNDLPPAHNQLSGHPRRPRLWGALENPRSLGDRALRGGLGSVQLVSSAVGLRAPVTGLVKGATNGSVSVAKTVSQRLTKFAPRGNVGRGAIDLMNEGDRFLINAARRTDVDPDGFLDVVLHGNSTRVQIGDRIFDHRALAQIIRRDPQFVGQDIRLLSCSTGACPTGIAQNLSNKLGVRVRAPTDTLFAFPDGRLTIGPTPNANTGRFVDFVPGGGR